jgi:hypothetical protein
MAPPPLAVICPRVTFRWLLNAEDYVPYAELAVIRQQVVLASTRVVGAMSRIRLGDISDDFIAKLKERVVAPKNVRGENSTVRGQVLKLCSGEGGACLWPSGYLLSPACPQHAAAAESAVKFTWVARWHLRAVCPKGYGAAGAHEAAYYEPYQHILGPWW